MNREKIEVTPKNIITDVPVISVKDWFITILITVIPLVNLIMYFVWAFSTTENPNRSNWAKAKLIWMLIGLGLFILFISAIMSFFGSMFSS